MTTALRIVLLVVAFLVTCSAVGPGDLSVVPASPSIQVGQSVQLQAVQDGRVVNAQWSSSLTSVATVTSSGLVTGRAAGEAAITARKGRWRASAVVMVSGGSTPPPSGPPPVSDSHRGPQASITCPSGSVDIWPGQSIQSVVDAHMAGTVFCLRAGVHAITSAIVPRTGDSFVGEYRAILDGSGWTTTDTTQGAFRAHNQDIDDVTIRNLVIREMPQRGIHAWHHMSDRWVIEFNEISDSKYGLNAPSASFVRANYIHHNIGDPASSNPADRGGAYTANLSNDTVFEDNEIAYNGPEQKVVATSRVTFRHNYVHHNVSGIWYDGGNLDALIEGNLVEDNSGDGIFYEISARATIRDNVIRRSGLAGIFISTSKHNLIYRNTLEDNFRGIQYFLSCPSIGEPPANADLSDNEAFENTTVVWTRSGSFAGILSAVGGCDLTPYMDGTKDLVFRANHYSVPSMTTRYWVWGGVLKSWSEWQALGHDVTGTVQ